MTDNNSSTNFNADGDVNIGGSVAGRDINITNIYGPPSTTSIDEAPAPGESPYMGLKFFREQDAALFFGREALTQELLAHVQQHPALAVIGASGSGKSSLVRAGLLPALSAQTQIRWAVHILTPTARPLEALAASLTADVESVTAAETLVNDLRENPRSLHWAAKRRLERASGTRLLVVVDQFEEVFTQCRNEAERAAFIENLLTAAQPEGAVTLVFTLRADFYSFCTPYPSLRAVLETQQKIIGPMSAEELRAAIEHPAQKNDWTLEENLTETLLRDLGGEPGALPLLSHALYETWQRRSVRKLTLRGYAASGGVQGAIAKTAESLYGALTPEQQTIARRIFLRLTELGEGTQDTRRRAALNELAPDIAHQPKVQTVLLKLADARLVTTEREAVEVAHEALIREWATLRGWLNADREGLRLHRAMTESAKEWVRLNKDTGALYRGLRLAQAQAWAEQNRAELSPDERQFLAASSAEAYAEHQKTLELETTKKLAESEKRAASRQRRLSAIIGVVGIIAAIMAVVAFMFAGQANTQALHAQEAQTTAEAAVAIAVPAQKTAEAASTRAVAQQSTAQVARTAAVAAQRTAVAALADAKLLRQQAARARQVVFSPTNDLLASANADRTLQFWDVSNPQLPVRVSVFSSKHDDIIWNIAFSADGRLLATASADQTVRLWDISDPTVPSVSEPIPHSNWVHSVAFSPDGKTLATADSAGNITLFDTSNVLQLVTPSFLNVSPHRAKLLYGIPAPPESGSLSGHDGAVWSIAFSPDGKILASGGADATVRLWDVSDRYAPHEVSEALSGHTDAVWSVAFNHEGTVLASGGADRRVLLWDISDPNVPRLLNQQSNEIDGFINYLAFSPNNPILAIASADNTARLWDVAVPTAPRIISLPESKHQSLVGSVAFSRNGQLLASASADQTIRLWDVSNEQAPILIGELTAINFELTPTPP